MVFDEVNEMVKMEFRGEIKNHIDPLPEIRQTLMISATMNVDIKLQTEQSVRVPVKIETEKTGSAALGISQLAYPAANINTKINLLVNALNEDKSKERMLIRCASSAGNRKRSTVKKLTAYHLNSKPPQSKR